MPAVFLRLVKGLALAKKKKGGETQGGHTLHKPHAVIIHITGQVSGMFFPLGERDEVKGARQKTKY